MASGAALASRDRGDWAVGKEKGEGGGKEQKLLGCKRKESGPVPSSRRSPAAAPGWALRGGSQRSPQVRGLMMLMLVFRLFFFSLLSLNAKQINPPPSAESFPLVLSVSLILCSWKLHYSDRSKSLLCGCYKTPPWLLKTASSAPRPRSESRSPLSDAPLSEPRTSGPPGGPAVGREPG